MWLSYFKCNSNDYGVYMFFMKKQFCITFQQIHVSDIGKRRVHVYNYKFTNTANALIYCQHFGGLM